MWIYEWQKYNGVTSKFLYRITQNPKEGQESNGGFWKVSERLENKNNNIKIKDSHLESLSG